MADGVGWGGPDGRCAHCAGRLGPPDPGGGRRCERCGRAIAPPAARPSSGRDRPPWLVVVGVVVLVALIGGGFEAARRRYRPLELADRPPAATTTTTTSMDGLPPARPSDPIDLPDAPEVVDPVALGIGSGSGVLVDRRLGVAVQADGRIDVAAIAGPPDQEGEVIVRLAAVDGRPALLGTGPLAAVDAPSERPPVVVDGTTFVQSQAQVLAFTAEGRPRWKTRPEEPVAHICTACSLGVGDTYVTTDPTGLLVGYRSASAEPVWSRGFGTTVLGLETDGEVVVVAHAVEGDLAISAVDAGTGAILRSTAVPCGRGGAEAAPDGLVLRRVPQTSTVVVATAGYARRVLCAARLEPQTGRVAWSLRQAGIAGVQDHVLLQGGLLVFQPSGASGTAWIDLEDGSYRSSPERALPVAVGGGLVVCTERDGEMGRPTIVALDRETGAQRWAVAPTSMQIGTWEVEGHVGATGPSEPPVFAVTASTAGVHAISLDAARRRVTVWDLDPGSGRAMAPRAFGLPQPVGALDPGWRSALLLVHADADRVVLQTGPWVALVPLVGAEGSWVWTSV